jgi:hypothetical protein
MEADGVPPDEQDTTPGLGQVHPRDQRRERARGVILRDRRHRDGTAGLDDQSTAAEAVHADA